MPANQDDRKGREVLLGRVRAIFPRLQHIGADQGQFQRWVQDVRHLELEVVHPWWRQRERKLLAVYEQLDTDFRVIASRRVVERTFGWWTYRRRLNRDYDLLPVSTQSFLYLAMIRPMLSRFAC